MPGSSRNFTEYPNQTSDDLLLRLGYLATELANLYEEIAEIEAMEVRQKSEAMLDDQSGTSSGRRDRVTMHVVEAPATRLQLEGQRDALVEEKFFIIRILDSRRP